MELDFKKVRKTFEKILGISYIFSDSSLKRRFDRIIIYLDRIGTKAILKRRWYERKIACDKVQLPSQMWKNFNSIF